MRKKITLFLIIVLALIALAVTACGGEHKNGWDALDASMVREGVVLANNHTEANVKILRIEDVVESKTPLKIRKVVVYLVLSGPGAEVLQGEQRWEINDFRQHHHVVNGGARTNPTPPLFVSISIKGSNP